MRHIERALKGIGGFDDITAGGLPRGRTTLLKDGAGSGKTIFALQFLVHGAKALDECGIFVSFEVVANHRQFRRVRLGSGAFRSMLFQKWS